VRLARGFRRAITTGLTLGGAAAFPPAAPATPLAFALGGRCTLGALPFRTIASVVPSAALLPGLRRLTALCGLGASRWLAA